MQMGLKIFAKICALFVVVLLTYLGCAGTKPYERKEFEMMVIEHHRNLRWGRFEKAAVDVRSDLKEKFLITWRNRLKNYDLHNIEIESITPSKSAKSYEVVVRLEWVDPKSNLLKSIKAEEVWEKEQEGWRVTQPLWPPF